jgi:hypothetical protein
VEIAPPLGLQGPFLAYATVHPDDKILAAMSRRSVRGQPTEGQNVIIVSQFVCLHLKTDEIGRIESKNQENGVKVADIGR